MFYLEEAQGPILYDQLLRLGNYILGYNIIKIDFIFYIIL